VGHAYCGGLNDAHSFARRYDVSPSVFRATVCAGANSSTVSRTAATRGKGSIRCPVRASFATTTGCKPDGDITRDGNTVAVHIATEIAQNQINNPSSPRGGKDNVKLRSYGGCLTGPVIEAEPGNTVRIFLDNRLDVNDPSCPADHHSGPGCFNTVNMHFHGLHVSPAGNSDNVLLNIAPHTSFEYELDIPADHPAGTFWYHAHRHGSTAIQVASGASGALIIRGNRHYDGGVPGDIDTILHDASGKPMTEQIFPLPADPVRVL